jgi:hypothetical protein
LESHSVYLRVELIRDLRCLQIRASAKRQKFAVAGRSGWTSAACRSSSAAIGLEVMGVGHGLLGTTGCGFAVAAITCRPMPIIQASAVPALGSYVDG